MTETLHTDSVEADRKRICDIVREKHEKAVREKKIKLEQLHKNDLQSAVINMQTGRKPKNTKKF